MGAPKWTPGPWRANSRVNAVVADEFAPGMYGVSPMAVDHYGGHLIGESIAPQNLAIIAAAPDLAEALEPFNREAEALLALGLTLNDETPVVLSVPSSALRKARLALSKARGETE